MALNRSKMSKLVKGNSKSKRKYTGGRKGNGRLGYKRLKKRNIHTSKRKVLGYTDIEDI